MTTQQPNLPFKISTLIFIEDAQKRHLLIKRKKSPNQGLWSPIGGKLEMDKGESPHQCACREIEEEIQWQVAEKDLHLFGMITEKAYEGSQHWLMFLYHCLCPLKFHPKTIGEGSFDFFSSEALSHIPIPTTDRQTLWKLYAEHRQGFVAGRIDCTTPASPTMTVEQIIH